MSIVSGNVPEPYADYFPSDEGAETVDSAGPTGVITIDAESNYDDVTAKYGFKTGGPQVSEPVLQDPYGN